MSYNTLFHSRLLKLSLFLYDFRAASPKENVESGSLSQIKPVKFIATHKFIEPCSIQRMQSLIQNPYLRKWSLHLRQYSIYRLHCITKVNTNDISIHHIYHYRVNIFRAFFFSLRWMECVCLHVGRRACCSQQKQVAFSHQPHVCLG